MDKMVWDVVSQHGQNTVYWDDKPQLNQTSTIDSNEYFGWVRKKIYYKFKLFYFAI